MRHALVVLCACIAFAGCTPKEVHRELTTFSYIPIDLAKIVGKDYAELIAAVNSQASPTKKEFVDARLFREEGMFMYFRIYSGSTTACYRVTVDRNRSKIISMQPDCPIVED